MPSLLHSLDDTIGVEFGQFVVQEISMSRSPLSLPAPAGEWLAVGGPGGLLLHSAGNDHYPTVCLELWDGAPPTAPGDWDQIVDLTCDLQSEVRLQTVMSVFSEHTLAITRQGLHCVRVHAGNRAEAAELEEATYVSGVERWLIQFWPA
jgi:hypothetical protein